jgi:S1-C subfamily serine protease
MSAFGLPGVTGGLVLEVPAGSALTKAGLQKNDVILSVNGVNTAEVASLLRWSQDSADGRTLSIVVSRNQKEITLSLPP